MYKRPTSRLGKLRKKALRDGVQAMLVTGEHNVKYLSGFTGDSTWLLVTKSEAILLSDTRYTTQIEEECPGFDVEIRGSRTSNRENLASLLKKTKHTSIAVESHLISKHQFDELDSTLEKVALNCTSGLVEELRAIKDSFEVGEIRKSVHIAQRAFDVIRGALTADQTESQIAADIEHQIRKFGGYSCSFDPIVGVGERGALPHAQKTDKRIGESPFVLIDWGARGSDYMSDITRMLVTGKTPAKFDKIYSTVLQAQLAAIKKVRPGVEAKVVDDAARAVIEKAGFGKKFGHGLGHGIGLEIHESPRLSPVAEGKLEAGMVITIEPGIYFPGFGGVRIEDDVLVTKDGHEVLTSLPKALEDAFVTL